MNTLEHQGTSWDEAPLPPVWHRCSPWSPRSVLAENTHERCACGAIRFDGYGRWLGRNERRWAGTR